MTVEIDNEISKAGFAFWDIGGCQEMGGRRKGKVQWVIFSYICFQIDNLLETIFFFLR